MRLLGCLALAALAFCPWSSNASDRSRKLLRMSQLPMGLQNSKCVMAYEGQFFCTLNPAISFTGRQQENSTLALR
jgi:hypothetical protein